MMVLPPCRWSTLCGAVLQLWLTLLHLCIFEAVLLSPTAGAQECISITPNVSPYEVKELLEKETSENMFYQCYESQSPTQQLQLTLNYLKFHGSGAMMVYTDATPKVYNTDCGGCSKPTSVVNNAFHITNFLSSFLSDNSEAIKATESPDISNEECHMCDTVLNGSFFEIHLRVSSTTPCEPDAAEECQSNVPDYNMTFSLVEKASQLPKVEEANCDDGQLVSFPIRSESCIVNVSSLNMIKQQCFMNTCSKEIMSPESTNEKIEHKFLPSNDPEFCLWELDTEQKKHIFLQFSKHVKHHITIFEGKLSEPVRDLEWCPIFGNNQFQMETKADKVFIIYNRKDNLDKKASVSISLRADLCPLPPAIRHGSVEFMRQETGTKAFYRCDSGFELLGQTEVACKHEAWEETPVCLPTEKEKLMSDEPVESIENVVSSSVIENIDSSTVNGSDSELLIKKNDSSVVGAETEVVHQGGSKMSLGIGQNDYTEVDEEEFKKEHMELESPEETKGEDGEIDAETILDIDSEDSTNAPLEQDIIKEEADISSIAIQEGNENEKVDETPTASDNDNNNESDGTNINIDTGDEDSRVTESGDVIDESSLQENGTSNLGKEDTENGGFSLEILNFRLEEEMLYYVAGGAAVLLLMIIICCISCCVYRRGRLSIGRTFDTFQNPIYEKTVVRMPMQQPETAVEVEREKMDLEEISDCTVLE